MGCHLVILACNTASAKALRSIQMNDLPQIDPARRVLGVIRPTVECVGEISKNQHIGVLATAGTIKSESYPLEIHKLFPEIQVSGTACPMWVSLVENNESQDEGADYFIRKVHRPITVKGSSNRILSSSDVPISPYSYLKIRQYIPDHISVITQGEYVAESLKDYLKRHPEMDAKCTKNGNCQFYTTEAEEKFSESASTFLKQQISVKHITLE